MFGTISTEMEMKVAASEAWKVYSTLRLTELARDLLPDLVQKIEVEGDGGAGTVLSFTFDPDAIGFSHYKEKFISIDEEKRIKVTEMIEGGLLDLGLDLYRTRFEVIEKQGAEGSCIIKSTIEYETNHLEAAKVAVISIQNIILAMKTTADYLSKIKSNRNCSH